MDHAPARTSGLALVELLVALAISAIIIAGLDGIVSIALDSRDATHERSQLVARAQFAMQRMVQAGRHSHALLLPLNDNPATDWPENLRSQTIPASAPVGSSTFASAVFAVALPAYSDLDHDGIADADDDGDGLIDEDAAADTTNDAAAGIHAVDDDGDGAIDEGDADDDDEDGLPDEDGTAAGDSDADGTTAEDAADDRGSDGCPGHCGIDDDGDGNIDEGGIADDDEDGSAGEDWINPLVFYLDNGDLVERTPVPWDTAGGGQDGRDYIESVIAEDVSAFTVERLTGDAGGYTLVGLSLQLTAAGGGSVQLDTRLRIGGAL